MKQRIRVYAFFFMLTFVAKAQFIHDYQPILKAESIPADFMGNPIEATKKNVGANKILSTQEAEDYYSRMNFFKYQLFQSGQLYLQNRITLYLDSVTVKLLSGEPKLQNEIRVYVTRFTEANAFCFPDGTVFVNIGLISLLENENELAFILAHEFAHYAEQHSIKDLKRLAQIEKEETNFSNENSSAYRSLRFSRESEFDADSWALHLIAQSGYNSDLAMKALTRLKPREIPEITFDFKKYFESENFRIDTIWCTKKAIKKSMNRYQENDEDPIASGKLDELFQTHPDIDKRYIALEIIAKNIKRKSALIPATKTSFETIRELARFEKVENNYQKQDYVNSVINAIHLLEKYPKNIYLHASISKSLYWLSYYKEISGDNLIMQGDPYDNGADFYFLYTLLNEMSLNDAKKLAYAYVRSKYDSYSDNEPILFYLALNTDNYLGKNAAREFYRDYIQKYPNGAFSRLTKTKLE